MTNTFVTVIGPGVTIIGSIDGMRDVIIHGEVEGNLNMENSRLTIGPKGKALGHASAREVDIQGSIEGDVDSTANVFIRSGGRLIGDIRTAGIVIEDGAVFRGRVSIVRPVADLANDSEVQ